MQFKYPLINQDWSRMIGSKKESMGSLIKAPAAIKNNIITFSSSYNAKQVDNYYNLVQQTETQQICQICLEGTALEDTHHMTKCKDVFCKECLHNYLLYRITAGDDILCPASSCTETVTKNDTCFKALPQWCRDRYDKIRLYNQNMGSTSKRLCSIPNCKGIVDYELKIIKCDQCSCEYCHQCKLKKHEGRSCEDAYGNNFKQWRRCPSCREFVEKRGTSNRMTCSCKHEFCAMCQGIWSQSHEQCQLQIDPILENVYNRQSIMQCCRCYNIFKGLFMILLLPLILVIAMVACILTLLVSVFGGFIFSPCYSRSQGYATLATVFCCPCIGIYSVKQAVSSFFCEMVKIACEHMKRYCLTIRALFCYNGSHSKLQETQSNAIQF